MRLLAHELTEVRIGRTAVLDRLVDLLLIQILRTWLDIRPESTSTSWLQPLSDPTLAAALTAIHADPGRNWTIASLAQSASVSRATMARRFTALVGQAPNTYLTNWRMDVAARQLRQTDRSIESIAQTVGYSSEFAFSKAFSRIRGIPPGRYRRLCKEKRSADSHDSPYLLRQRDPMVETVPRNAASPLTSPLWLIEQSTRISALLPLTSSISFANSNAKPTKFSKRSVSDRSRTPRRTTIWPPQPWCSSQEPQPLVSRAST